MNSAKLIAKNHGTFTAPGANKQAYKTFPLDLGGFPSGGTLVIEAALGGGESSASFDLFPDQASVPNTGPPVKALKLEAQPAQYDIPPGTCVTLRYSFNQNSGVVFGVTGNWGSRVGAPNTFQFVASVEPSTSWPASVSIFKSPVVPNTGGHGILDGIMRLDFRSSEPSWKICISPQRRHDRPSDKTACTRVCPHGHVCLDQPFMGVAPPAGILTVDLIDQDKPGSELTVDTFDIDPRTCETSACSHTIPAGPGVVGPDLELQIGFHIGSGYMCTTDRYQHWESRPVSFTGGTVINKEYQSQVEVRAPLHVTGVGRTNARVFTSEVEGISVTVKSPPANVLKVIQAFYRERIPSNGKALSGNQYQYSADLTYVKKDTVYSQDLWYTPAISGTHNIPPESSFLPMGAPFDPKIHWVLLNDPACSPESTDVNYRTFSANPKDPNTWHIDGVHSAYWPDYSPYNVVFGCGGLTFYDTPTLLFGSGPETWRFTAKDYVIEGQRVFWVVTWTRTRPPNATQDQFAATVEKPTAAMVDALNILLKKEGLFAGFKP